MIRRLAPSAPGSRLRSRMARKRLAPLTLAAGLAAASLGSAAMPGQAAASVVLPDGNSSYYFSWHDGLGPISAINFDALQTSWQVSLAAPADLSITVMDMLLVGDAFTLLHNGTPLAWDDITSPGGHFTAHYATRLAAGSHEFSILVSALSAGLPYGLAQAEFTLVDAVLPIGASLPFLLTALSGVAGLRRAQAGRRSRRGVRGA